MSIGHHFVSFYLDLDDSIRQMNWDDVVDFPVVDLPPIIGPTNTRCSHTEEVREAEDAHVPIQIVYAEQARG